MNFLKILSFKYHPPLDSETVLQKVTFFFLQPWPSGPSSYLTSSYSQWGSHLQKNVSTHSIIVPGIAQNLIKNQHVMK